jgi:hypothetical protein
MHSRGITFPEGLGTVKALPRDVGALSVVEIEWGFAYDGAIFRRILSTPSFIVPDRPDRNPRKGGED